MKLVVQLIDSRIGPTKDDLDMMEYMTSCGLPFIIVATKSDKLNAAGRAKIAGILKNEPLCSAAVGTVAYSSVNHSGRDEVWRLILDSCADKQEEI